LGRAWAEEKLAKPTETARYSISAYGSEKAGGVYIIDVQTGEMFHAYSDSAPKSFGKMEKK
jgi:hypothetical protein